MKKLTTLVPALLSSTILFGAAAHAQDAPHAFDIGRSLPLSQLRDPNQVYFSEPGDGAIAARGDSYAADFDARGTSFMPLFGADAPRRFPARFHLDAAHCGDAAVTLAPEVAPERDGGRVALSRGAITEMYELAPQSMEQEFVIPHSLGQGTVRLRVGVETELDVRATEEGLEFTNELGSIKYSRAVAVDALGARADAPTSWVNGAIEIQVPAEFLARARYPVTVDPLIFSFSITNGTNDDFAPDLAYDASTDRFLVVYEEALSAFVHQLWAVEYTGNGSVVAGSLKLLTGHFLFDTRPRVASNNPMNQFMIVWSESGLLGGQSKIVARTYAASTFALGTAITVSPSDSLSRVNPDIGGDTQNAGNTYYSVVWERIDSATKHTIEGQLLSPFGALTGAVISLDASNFLNANPRISKSDGQAPLATMDWTVVWQKQFNATDHDIYGAQIHRDGIVTQPAFAIDAGLADDTHPAVSSIVAGQGLAPREYLVTFERNIGGRHDIMGALRQGIAVFNEQDLTLLEQGTVLADNTLSSVETDGVSFVVLCAQYWFGVHDVYLAWFAPVGSHLEIQTQYEIGPIDQADTMSSRLASTYDGGGSTFRMFGVGDTRPTASANRAVWGFVHDTSPFAVMCTPGDGVTAPCPCNNPGLGIGWGCNNSANTGGGTLLVYGTAVPGVPDTVVLYAGHMLPNATCTFWQGDGVSELGLLFGSGQRCFAGHLIRLGTEQASGGSATYPSGGDLSISSRSAAVGAPILPGTTRWYQTSYRDANSPCGVPATFNATAGVQIYWQ